MRRRRATGGGAPAYRPTFTERGALLWDPAAEGADVLAADLRGAGRAAVCRVARDLFAGDVDDGQRAAAWDAMWSHPRVTFLVEAADVEAMRLWVLDHASRRNFHYWSPPGAPTERGELVDIDTLFGRGVCGWSDVDSDEHNGYGCAHPRSGRTAEPGACFAHSCPIAWETPICGRCGEGEDDCACPEGYESTEENPMMRLHERPRDAMAGNVWLGVRATPGAGLRDRLWSLKLADAGARFVRVDTRREADAVARRLARARRGAEPDAWGLAHDVEWVVLGDEWRHVGRVRLPFAGGGP